MARKRKKLLKKPALADVRRLDSGGGGGNGWFGEPDLLTDASSQKESDPGAGLSAPNWSPDAKPRAELSKADSFVAAIISGDRERITAAYEVLKSDVMHLGANGLAIKASFASMPAEQRKAVVATVDKNQDVFGFVAVTAFKSMIEKAPPPPKEAKPLNFDPVALEGQDATDAISAMGRTIPRDQTRNYTAADLTSRGVGSKYAAQTAERINSLDPSIRERYAATVVDFAKQYGSQGYDITINRAGVSAAEQRHVNATISGRAARPENSWHTIGGAADFSIYKNGVLDKGDKPDNAYKTLLPAVLAPNGLSNPFPDDVGHVQPSEVPQRRAGKSLADFIKPVAAPVEAGAVAGKVAGPGAPTGGGTPEARQVRDLLTSGRADLGVKPLPAHIAAGAVGNMMQEAYANLRPDAKGAAGEKGIGQWMPDRYANMVAWTTANGLDPNSREGQALFYSHELQTSPTMAKLANIGTPAEAAQIIATSFERAGNPQMEKRIGFANAVAVGATEIAGAEGQDVVAGRAVSVGGAERVAAAIRASGGLRKGSRNVEANKAIQAALNELGATDRFGHPLKEDGVFGNRTKEAVKAYQTKEGLRPDGVVGRLTYGKISADMMPMSETGAGMVGSPELAGQVPHKTRDYAAGAAAAAVTVDPVVSPSFGASASFTLKAVIEHQADPQTFAQERNWDAASARIANTLRDGDRMAEEARVAMGKAGKTSYPEPVQAAIVPRSLSEWLGPRPGEPIQEHQAPEEHGLMADAQRAWDSVRSGYDVETWLSAPTVQDSSLNSSSGSSGSFVTDPFRPTGGYDSSGSGSGSGFDSFASGMSSTYQTVGGGSSVFSSSPSTYEPGGSNTSVQTDAAGRVLGGI